MSMRGAPSPTGSGPATGRRHSADTGGTLLIIAGHITVDPGDREDYLRGCADVVEQARKAEGCPDFSLSADLADPGRIDIYERWESDAHLAAFRGEGVPDEQASRILDAGVYKYRVSDVEAP